VNGRNYSATFATGNLRTLGAAAFEWCFRGHRPEARRVVVDFSVISGAFLLGAAAGAYGVNRFANHALLGIVFLLVIAAIRVRPKLQKLN